MAEPGFDHTVATERRREVLLGFPWPGPMAVGCGGAERLIVAADEVFPDVMRSEAYDLVEAAWTEVLAPGTSTPEALQERRRSAHALYDQCEGVRDRGVFRAMDAGCMVLLVVLGALRERDAGRLAHLAISPLKEGLEGVAEWATADLMWTYGSGDRFAIADIYRHEAFVRELAAWDADIATVQQRGVTAESVTEIRQRAHDVGLQHQQTIIRALTVDRLPDEEIERRRREGP